MARLRVASYNLGDGPADAKWDDLNRLADAGIDVICLQEGGDRTKLLEHWARVNGWRLWLGRVPGSKSVPILYRRGLGARRFSRLAVPRMYVGAGAGPSWAKSKAITGIRVGDLVVFNTHMTPSATRRGPKYRLRRVHYRLHVAVLAGMCKRRINRGRQVMAVGDFNAEPGFRLLAPIRDVLHQWTGEPTHGLRRIDLIWAQTAEAATVVRDLSSDHAATIATIGR